MNFMKTINRTLYSSFFIDENHKLCMARFHSTTFVVGILWYCMSNTQRHARILQIALKFGADVNNKAKNGKPVFVEACELSNENEEFCLTLLKEGAESNSIFEVKGYTALMAACRAGNAKVTAAILAAGADPDTLDKWKSHASHYAARS